MSTNMIGIDLREKQLFWAKEKNGSSCKRHMVQSHVRKKERKKERGFFFILLYHCCFLNGHRLPMLHLSPMVVDNCALSIALTYFILFYFILFIKKLL
jgi:hypothetical protein